MCVCACVRLIISYVNRHSISISFKCLFLSLLFIHSIRQLVSPIYQYRNINCFLFYFNSFFFLLNSISVHSILPYNHTHLTIISAIGTYSSWWKGQYTRTHTHFAQPTKWSKNKPWTANISKCKYLFIQNDRRP